MRFWRWAKANADQDHFWRCTIFAHYSRLETNPPVYRFPSALSLLDKHVLIKPLLTENRSSFFSFFLFFCVWWRNLLVSVRRHDPRWVRVRVRVRESVYANCQSCISSWRASSLDWASPPPHSNLMPMSSSKVSLLQSLYYWRLDKTLYTPLYNS